MTKISLQSRFPLNIFGILLLCCGIAGAQPTPSQILVARERFHQLTEGLPAHQRIVLEFLRQGSTHQEIADALGINEKSIRRLVEKIAPELLPDDVAGSATTS